MPLKIPLKLPLCYPSFRFLPLVYTVQAWLDSTVKIYSYWREQFLSRSLPDRWAATDWPSIWIQLHVAFCLAPCGFKPWFFSLQRGEFGSIIFPKCQLFTSEKEINQLPCSWKRCHSQMRRWMAINTMNCNPYLPKKVKDDSLIHIHITLFQVCANNIILTKSTSNSPYKNSPNSQGLSQILLLPWTLPQFPSQYSHSSQYCFILLIIPSLVLHFLSCSGHLIQDVSEWYSFFFFLFFNIFIGV